MEIVYYNIILKIVFPRRNIQLKQELCSIIFYHPWTNWERVCQKWWRHCYFTLCTQEWHVRPCLLPILLFSCFSCGSRLLSCRQETEWSEFFHCWLTAICVPRVGVQKLSRLIPQLFSIRYPKLKYNIRL